MIKISKRLMMVSSFIKRDEIILDVGTDHGLLPMYLVENKKVKKAYASDVIESIVNKTKDSIKEKGFDKQIEIKLSDGLKNINYKDVTTIVIAGMGGILISNILKAKTSYIKNKKLVLGPHRDADIVRKTLHELGFKITKEEILEDQKDKYYVIIEAKMGNDTKYNDYDYMLGKKLINSKTKNLEFIKYLNFLINKNKNIIMKLKKSNNTKDRILELENENKKIKDYLEKEKSK